MLNDNSAENVITLILRSRDRSEGSWVAKLDAGTDFGENRCNYVYWYYYRYYSGTVYVATDLSGCRIKIVIIVLAHVAREYRSVRGSYRTARVFCFFVFYRTEYNVLNLDSFTEPYYNERCSFFFFSINSEHLRSRTKGRLALFRFRTDVRLVLFNLHNRVINVFFFCFHCGITTIISSLFRPMSIYFYLFNADGIVAFQRATAAWRNTNFQATTNA